jgi:predicted dehydrogenase
MLWLTGERPVRVSAVGNRIATEETSFRYQDFAAATFEFPSTLVGRITANFGSVHSHQHVVRVFGTQAAFLYDDAGARLHRSRDPASVPEALELPPLPASKGDLIGSFVGGILAGGDARESIQHELDVISACVCAQRALQEGGAVDIEYA